MITSYFTIISIQKLAMEFDLFSSYLMRISNTLLSILALTSLLFSKLNGERFVRFFIIGVLIFPMLLLVNQYCIDLLIYGINRTNLLQNTVLNLFGIVGVVLYLASYRFSKQTKVERQKDIGLLILGIGFFITVRTIIIAIESNFVPDMNKMSLVESGIKISIILILFLLGYKMSTGKIKFNKGILFTALILFINQIV
ncbi:hypothetical protein [Flavobacterium sp.]|uniref:hypothetical protein n=1 Tax=Flavobacterium sp. TaxID=239 RepID=UPI002B4B2F9C|nr:hypothetical protein [Flavobacterium sp.]HLP63106.1 hypothetical protein [Flavobacterium sp.]